MSEPDLLGHLSADEKEALAAEAAATVNRTLAELFLRLGPPPGPTDNQTPG